MKTCPVCGLDVEDSYLFCPDDGSGLVGDRASEASFTGALAAGEPTIAEAGSTINDAVVLYCGECAAEYPMTFVECPVHHVLLTRDRRPTIAGHPDPPAESPSIHPRPENEEFASIEPNLESQVRERNQEYASTLFASRNDAPSFRIVAATIVMGLVLFCVAAVFIFFSAGGRKQPVARASLPDVSAATQELAFVPTPDSARDYEEEQPQQQPIEDPAARPPQNETASAPAPSMPRLETKGPEPRNTKGENGSARPTPVSMYRTSTAGGAAASPRMSIPSTGRESASPRVDSGNVDARLIRVRSMRTESGVRYDLTFDLQDESGRHSQWERMLISTRSGSGVNHTQTVPFVHRLGANGALTFTVSVEMRGHSEPDLRGRVVCTTSGADIDGRPLRASFGANVTP